MRALTVVGDYTVAFSHCARDPGEFRILGQCAEGGDYAAAAPPSFGPSIGGHVVFYRAAIASQDQGAARQYSFA